MKELNLISFTRLSTLEQSKEGKAGRDRQVADIQGILKRHEARQVRHFDIIESGAYTEDDPQFQQMWTLLHDPNVHGVACSAVDRVVRPDGFNAFGVFERFRVNGKKLFLPSGIIDFNTQTGFMETVMKALFAGMERQTIRERTMGGRERLRVQGRWAVGPKQLARGVLYDRATNKFSYDLDPNDKSPRCRGRVAGDALLVKRAMELTLRHNYSYEAVARILGAGWTASGIKTSLRNPIWKGILRFGTQLVGPVRYSRFVGEDGKHKKYRDKGPRETVIEHRVIDDPLVTPEYFAELQAFLDKRAAGNRGLRKKAPKFLLASLIRCVCGKRWYMKTRRVNKKVYEHYYCGSRCHKGPTAMGPKGRATEAAWPGACGAPQIERTILENTVIDLLASTMLDPQTRIEMMIANPPAPQQGDGEIQRKQLLAERERVQDMYQEGDIDRATYRKRIKGIDERSKALNIFHPPPVVPIPQSREIAAHIAGAFVGLRNLSFADQRDLLQRAVRQIMISGQMVLSLTLSGGFLGEVAGLAKISSRLTKGADFDQHSDLVIEFPQPIPIVGGRAA